MHMTIRVIVPAKSEDEAFSQATNVLEEMCGEGKAFDYFSTADEWEEDGKGIPKCPLAKSPEGSKWITEGMEATVREFKDHMARVRKAVAYSDEEIMEEKALDEKEGMENGLFLARHSLYRAGAYDGSSVWLYDEYGSGIRTQRELKRILTNDGKTPKKGIKLYVVPADVHF